MSFFSFSFVFSYTKSENRKAEQVLQEVGVNWYQWEGRGGREMVNEGENGANTVYTCM
jgi:hypothetical protein